MAKIKPFKREDKMEVLILKEKEFIIRNFCEDDLHKPEKFFLYIDNLINDSSAMIPLRVRKTPEEGKKWLKNMLSIVKFSKMVVIVAEFDDQIVGGVEVSLCPEYGKGVAEFSISIIKDYRGYGLGSYLLPTVINMAKKNLKPKPTIIRLSVFSSNKQAIALYQKHGFKVIARMPKHFEFDSQFIDEIIMSKFI